MLSLQTENSLKFHFLKFLLQNLCQCIDVYGKNVFNQLSVLKYVKFPEEIQPTSEAERSGSLAKINGGPHTQHHWKEAKSSKRLVMGADCKKKKKKKQSVRMEHMTCQ